MTTPSTERKAGPLLGTGAQTTWPFTFKVFAATDIAVTIADSLGVETALVYGVDYTVTLNSNQETSPGGTVTYPISGAALAVGKRLVIVGALPYDQPLDLPAGGNFSPLALENELDRLTMQIQQLRERVGRALQVSVTTGANVGLPAPSANELIGWDSTGQNLQNFALSELATAVAYATMRYDTFTGDGTETQFTLTADPVTLANLDIAISGVTQVPGSDYSLLNGVLVFASAPANGTQILARYGEGLVNVGGDSSDIRFLQAGTGAVTRTVEGKLREWVSVKDSGAVGDGVTDDTAAIQATIDAVFTAGGGVIYAPAGTYLVSAPVAIKDKCLLRGAGHATVFKAAAGHNAETISIRAVYPVNKVFDAGVMDLAIDGNSANNTYAGVTDAGVRVQADVENPFTNGSPDKYGELRNIVVSNIYVRSHRTGMYVGKTTFVQRSYTFDRIHTDQCSSSGLYLDNYCEYVNLADCMFENCYDGVYDNGSSNITFSNCFITNNSNSGANLYTTGRNTSKKNFIGCTFNHNRIGIWVQTNTGTVGVRHSLCNVTGCHFMANTRHGIAMIGGFEFSITGNVFSGNSEGNSGVYPDIYVADIVKDTVITGNVFKKGVDTKCAVELLVESASAGVPKQYNIIANNTSEGYTTAAPPVLVVYPSTSPLNANTNIIDGYMEFWNGAGKPPSASADNAGANLNLAKIPWGTVLVNRGTDNEYWMHMRFRSLGASYGAMIPVVTTGIQVY
jgi:hypothetical protein